MSSEKPKRMDADEVIRRYYEGVETGHEGAFPEDTLASVLRTNRGSADETVHDATLSGGDIDATQSGIATGEETVGGSTPTPDQDIVDELGKAAGITYEDAEPLRFGDKVADRDAQRWELNPASSEGYQDRLRELSEAGETLSQRPTRRGTSVKDGTQHHKRKTASLKKTPKKRR